MRLLFHFATIIIIIIPTYIFFMIMRINNTILISTFILINIINKINDRREKERSEIYVCVIIKKIILLFTIVFSRKYRARFHLRLCTYIHLLSLE